MFKVGDKVIWLVDDPDQWDINAIHEIKEHSHGQFKVYLEEEFICWCGDRVFYQEFRHATNEEIAAGHRIDTKTGVTVITPKGISKAKGGLTAFVDMGDDSHIENHVSPNCKKFDERVNSNETN